MSEENLQEQEQTEVLESTVEDETPQVETVEVEETPAEEKEARGKEAPLTQDRFDEIYGISKRSQRENERLRRENAALRARNEKPTREIKQKPRPRLEDFEDHDQHSEAVADWKYDQRESAKIVETEKQEQERIAQDREDTFYQQVDESMRLDPDFMNKGYIHEDLKFLTYDSDHFQQLAYYFKDNPSETQRILSYAPDQRRASREIGKIEASFGRPKPRTETKAPSKTRPVGSNARVTKKPEDMEEQEYMSHRKKQLGYG